MPHDLMFGPHLPAVTTDQNKYPYQRIDGRWCIAHDEEWNEIIVDDMEGIDPSQFQVQYDAGPCTSLVLYNPGPLNAPGTSSSDPLNLDTAAEVAGDPAAVAESTSQTMDWTGDAWGEIVPAAPHPTPGPGVTGLTNLGNTCFMNAGLQCLFNNPHLVQYFLSAYPKGLDHKLPENCLTSCFRDLFIQVWAQSRTEPLKPSDFKESVGRTHTQFKDFRQHDCQEFLALLLGTLQEQLSPSAIPVPAPGPCHAQQLNKMDAPDLIPAPESCVPGAESSTDTSSVSSQSSSVDLSTDSFRCEPLPANVASFSVPSDDQQNNLVSLDQLNKHTHSRCLNGNHSNIIAGSLVAKSTTGSSETLKMTLNDLSKQVKVANSNLQADEAPKNNQLSYNSSKFPKMNELPKQDVLENLRTDLNMTDGDDSSKQLSLKRCKTTNVTLNGEIVESDAHNSMSICKMFTNSKMTQTTALNFDCKRIKTSSSPTAEASGSSSTSRLTPEAADLLMDQGSSEWNIYLERNKSVIVDTFHGQFRSTVICSKCNHVSVTFEPFMYLPVPLPHALERQVILTFVSFSKSSYGSRSASPVRYLIDVHKYDRLSKVIIELKSLLKSEQHLVDDNSKIVIAEVRKNTVERILEDGMLLRCCFTDDRNLFAFELPPVPSFACSSDSLSLKDDPTPPDSNEMESCQHFDISDVAHAGQCDELDGLEFNHLSPNVSPIKATDSSEQGWPSQDSGIGDDHRDCGETLPPLLEIDLPISEPFDRTRDYVAQTTGNPDAVVPPAVDYMQCCVCLELKSKDELVEHPSPCSCVICAFCLDRHLEVNPINQTDRFYCPTCHAECTKSEFLPFDKSCLPSPAKTIIVPVIFRVENNSMEKWDEGKFQIVCHPVLLQLPNQMTCPQLYESVESFVPFPLPFTLRYVNSSGQKCSRCSVNFLKSDCTGCEIARIGSVLLNYSDTIAVEFDVATERDLLDAGDTGITEHESMTKRRPVEELKLEDCIREFHQSEVLDDENPWYCPSCCSNQRAHKSLSICRSPPTLMVYLKRFIFHDMMPIKVDDPVSYPMQLTIGDSLKNTGDHHSNYDLEALVCHDGGVNAGHYTAYAKHCVTGMWMYCNDSSVTLQDPSLNDERAYVLFYRRSDGPVDLSAIPITELTDDKNQAAGESRATPE